MKKMIAQRRKKMALMLAAALTAGAFWTAPASGINVQASQTAGGGNAPDVTAYAEPDQLEETTSDIIIKLSFGKNDSGAAQEWYVLGTDSNITGDNTVLFAAGLLKDEQAFGSQADLSDYIKSYDDTRGCVYPTGTSIEEVYTNHYGTSNLRAALEEMETDTAFFSTAEQALMNDTTITTNDMRNEIDYQTSDKLYAAAYESGAKVGAQNQIAVPSSIIAEPKVAFWFRTGWIDPAKNPGFAIMYTKWPNGNMVYSAATVNQGTKSGIRPAFDLDLSSVLFASAAPAALTEACGTIAEGTAMKLRLDGSNMAIGEAKYDSAMILAQKDENASGTVMLVVQGNDGTNNWYYAKEADQETVVTASDIKSALNLTVPPSLTDCKVWLETAANDMIYAKKAEPTASISERIESVEITIGTPEGGQNFAENASVNGEGIAQTSQNPVISWKKDGADVDGCAQFGTVYTAEVTLTADTDSIPPYSFDENVTVTVNGKSDGFRVIQNADGTITVSIEVTVEAAPHTHVWSEEWDSDDFFHWHNCTADNCDVTENSEKDGYAAHIYDQETVSVDTLKSEASADSAAVYYKSCICGAISTTETFTFGEPVTPSEPDKTDEEKLEEAVNAVQEAVAALKVSNDTVAEDIIDAVEAALEELGYDNIAVTMDNFTVTDAQKDEKGRVTGTVQLTLNEVKTEVWVSLEIEQTSDGPEEPVEPEEPAEPEESEKAEKYVCNHVYEWRTEREATEIRNAEEVYECKFCGHVKARIEVVNSAYALFNKNAITSIDKAAAGAVVTIKTELWESFQKSVIETLKTRPDVTVVLHYRYKGIRYTLTIPAGADLSVLQESEGYYGFRYLDLIFGGHEVK